MDSPRDRMERVLREVVLPLLAADGAELYVVELSDSSVVLHLGGRYSGNPGTNLVRRRILEPALRSAVPEVVIQVSSGFAVPKNARSLTAADR